MDEESFSLVFSLTRASAMDVSEEIQRLNDVRSTLSPYLKTQQTSSSSSQKGSQTGHTTSNSNGKTLQEKRGLFPSIWQGLFGAKKGGRNRIAPSYSSTSSESSSRTTTESTSVSHSTSLSYSDSGLAMIDNHLELLVEHLRQCLGTGGFHGAVTVHAPDSHSRKRVANCLIGVLSGSQTQLRPFQQIECSGSDACFDIRSNLAPGSVVDGIALMNVHHASELFLLPESELPGVQLKRSIFYGRASEKETSDDSAGSEVSLGIASFGEALSSGYERGSTEFPRREVSISSRHLLSHMLITGATGSGKTVRTIKLLNRLPEDQFIIHVLETAKKVYRGQFRRGWSAPRIYNLGGFDGEPLRINPFFFDEGTSLKRHISILCDALSDLLPVEALIGPKLREAVLECYNSCGWNIETGRFGGDYGTTVYPDMIEFNREIARICSRLGYSSELNENYRGALSGRARVFIDDLYQDVFSHNGNTQFDKLFGGDCILELADLPPSEINMPAFIVSLYLERLRAWRSALPDPAAPPYSIVVIEEAHNILHKKLEAEKNQFQTGGGKHLVEQVNRLLQEGRELGIGVVVIDQSPRSLADSVMINTNTKLIHRLLDGDEAGAVGKSIGLKPDEWQDIHFLEDGECIVSLKHGGRPHKLAPFEENELPEKVTIGPSERTPPEYAAVARLLRGASKLSSLRAIRQMSAELLQLCNGDLGLADYMIGKHLAWNHLLQEDADLTRSRGEEDIAVRLCELNKGGLNPSLEFSRLLVGLIMDCRYEESDIAERVFGLRWEDAAASALLQCTRRLGERIGTHESVMESWHSVLTSPMTRGSGQSRLSRESITQLKVLTACPENLRLLGSVISSTLCEMLLASEGFAEELAPCVLSGSWQQIHETLQHQGHLAGFEPMECFITPSLFVRLAGLLIGSPTEGGDFQTGIGKALDDYCSKDLGAPT